MPSLLRRLLARPRAGLAATAAVVLAAAVFGAPVVGILGVERGFFPRDAESALALERIESALGTGATPGVVVVQRTAEPAGTPAGRAETARLAAELRTVPGIAAVSATAPSGERLVSSDGTRAALTAMLDADADHADVHEALVDRYGEREGVLLGGSAIANTQMPERVSEDLGRAEMLAFPLLLVLSLVFFRGRRAATIPLVVGVTTVLVTFLALRGVNEMLPLSVFALNLVIGLGLGLAIDYTLLLLTRFREELGRSGRDDREAVHAAIAATMSTAGRTVAFSAATVAIALATLTVFPMRFLESMGIGGAAVAIVAAIAALTLTPLFLALWGPRLRTRADGSSAAGRWTRLSRGVMRRPGTVAAVTTVVMVGLALPALRAEWTPVDASVIPADLSSRQVADALAQDFPRDDSSPIVVALSAPAGAEAQVAAFARRAGDVDGVARTTPPVSVADDTWRLDVAAEGALEGPVARAVVEDIRALPAPFAVAVGGEAAEFVDQQAAIGDRLPLAFALLAVLTFTVLWLMTGSVVLPLKAILMNVLTVGTTLGVLVLVFQDGRLEGLLGFESGGGVEPTDFVVTAALVFALSTDYGVFLLERIREDRRRGLGERAAVAAGLGRTGAVVTAAAILLAVAIGAFSTSSVPFIKQVGVGAAVGVLVDAFVVRALLVPSLMALLGSRNWWSPPPLARLHRRLTGEPDAAGATRARGAVGDEALAPS